jgi:hypothetical protein
VYLALPICDFLENLLAFLPPNVFLVHFCTVVFSSSEFFKDVGEITDVRLAKDENGRSKGYGHIEFVSEEEAQQAVLKNGETLEGRDLFIDLAKERGAAGYVMFCP